MQIWKLSSEHARYEDFFLFVITAVIMMATLGGGMAGTLINPAYGLSHFIHKALWSYSTFWHRSLSYASDGWGWDLETDASGLGAYALIPILESLIFIKSFLWSAFPVAFFLTFPRQERIPMSSWEVSPFERTFWGHLCPTWSPNERNRLIVILISFFRCQPHFWTLKRMNFWKNFQGLPILFH